MTKYEAPTISPQQVQLTVANVEDIPAFLDAIQARFVFAKSGLVFVVC